jgi:predicted PurR-regulated permease PerM
VDPLDHLKLTGTALKRWLIAQSLDALIVGLMWLVGLEIIRVPLAPLWAVLGGILQFVPHFGPMVALRTSGPWWRLSGPPSLAASPAGGYA